jgi:hypothetical protein
MVVCERLDEQWGIQFGGVLRQSLKGWVLFAAEAVRPRLASASRTRKIEAIREIEANDGANRIVFERG